MNIEKLVAEQADPRFECTVCEKRWESFDAAEACCGDWLDD